MKTTYLFEFLVFPNDKQKQRPIYIKAPTEDAAALSEDKIRGAAAAIAAKDIPEMKPLDANPGRLIETSEEDSPVQFLRHEDHPGVIAWETNRRPKSA